MTTPWKIKPIWQGATVAVLASGPSMSRAVAESLREHKCIAVNHTHLLAPWADMMLALDRNLPMWAAAKDFKGMRICGVQDDLVDANYIGHLSERVVISVGNVVDIMNSGLAAIRLAARLGAARIILAGFEPKKAGHFAGRPGPEGVKQHGAVAIGLANMVKELRAAGIVVEFHMPDAQAKAPARRTLSRARRGGI